MSTEQRLKRLEDRIVCLEAIVDGSQAQTREGAAYIVGLVARYLHENGLIDTIALRRYVVTFGGDAADAVDYIGDLVRQLAAMLEFQEQNPADFALPPDSAARGA